MPPFRLEHTEKPPERRSQSRILYTKAEYQKGVLVSDWEKRTQMFPIDNDPYCPGSLNFLLPHYNSFGVSPKEPLTTTTRQMLEQVYQTEHLKRLNDNKNKKMVNYYTYKDTAACGREKVKPFCPTLCAESYISTMQQSYPPPYPYVMKRLSIQTPSLSENRRVSLKNQTQSTEKFLDDDYLEQICRMRSAKKSRDVSFNPCTLTNTDGTIPYERVQKCFPLDFIRN